MDNIILIGMPGAGKSTLGVLLAKALLYDFCDTDLLIQNENGKALSAIIAKEGTAAFLKKENDTLAHLFLRRTVIATGGSAVYSGEGMAHLKESGTVVYLSLPLSEIEKRVKDIVSRGVVLTHGSTLRELYEEREPLYRKYADLTVSCEGHTVEENVNAILRALQ